MIEYIGVGKIPIFEYLAILDRRCYCSDMAIEYTKNIYDVDISNDIYKYQWWDYKSNVFERFNANHPSKNIDDKTRNYFVNEGRNRYLKFYTVYKENDGLFDLIIDWCTEASAIHHIYPLVYGGDSSLLNLLPITNFHHKILHTNPMENERKYCFMAVDYLSSLYCMCNSRRIYEGYNMKQYESYDPEFKHNFLVSVIKNEMNIFYKLLI